MRPGELFKRVFVGRPLRSDRLAETLLPKFIALPIFSSDPLSSVAYATEEILLVLGLAGTTYYHVTPYLAAAIVALLAAVVFSYRKTVHAYPSGGGDYEVASDNFGQRAGIVVASALMTDYVMTVAVSTAAGVAAITSAAPSLLPHRVPIAIAVIVFMTTMNLRGVRESGRTFAIPTYGFVAGVLGLIAVGVVRALVTGHVPQAETAHARIVNTSSFAGLGLVFLAMRAFASGCTALTGVEAIANGVPAFRKPKSKNAATTLLMMGTLSVTMFVGITALALGSHVHTADSPAHLAGLAPGQAERTVIAQVGLAIYGHNFGFFYLQAFTAAILVLAANTAFNGFPVLASILARDGFLPRQLHNRGDRLVFSNGIVLLAAFAAVLIWAFHANTNSLIQLYIIGVFVSFTTSQLGMVRHWTRKLREEAHPKRRAEMKRSRVIQGFGGCFTGFVLIIELITKFLQGAWIAVVSICVLFFVMNGIHRHYQRVRNELQVDPEARPVPPARNHALVLVSKVHAPTVRAIGYAKSTRPHDLEAVTVAIDQEEADELQRLWDQHDFGVPLTIIHSPYRDLTEPIVDYVKKLRRQRPREVVTVFIPEYVVGHWWEALLHNQSALRLKGRLLFEPGVMVTSVPWQLRSSRPPTDMIVHAGRSDEPPPPFPGPTA